MSDQVIGDVDQVIAQEFKPALSGMGMEKTITVFNPLPLDFRVKYARNITANVQMSPEMQYTKEKTGLDLSKRGGVSGQVSHTIILKSKTSTNLPGDIAQIAVQKLVNVIIQTRNDDGSYDFGGHGGNKGMVPDPHRRQQVEQEVIRGIKDTMSMMNRETPEQFTERQIEELNSPVEEATDEKPAPGTGSNYTPEEAVPTGSGQPSPEEPTASPKPATLDKPKRGRPKATSLAA
jgi:hypothetical protein